MVESNDMTTDAGLEMYASLMQMSGAASSFYDHLAQQADEAARAAEEAARAAEKQAQEAKRAQDEYEAAQKAAQEAEQAFKDMVDGFYNSIKNIPIGTVKGMDFDGASYIIDAFGRDSEAVRAIRDFYNSFYSETERFAVSTDQAIEQLHRMGIEVPHTAEGWRTLVGSIQVVDEESAALYQTLLGLSGSMSELYRNADRAAQETVRAERERYNGLIQAAEEASRKRQEQIRDHYDTQTSIIRESINTASDLLRSLAGIADSSKKAFESLAGISEQGSAMLRDTAKEIMQTALASARLGKSVAGIEGLSDSLNALRSISSSAYSAFADYER